MKLWRVHYHSRYYKLDKRTIQFRGYSRKDIRENWHILMGTDEFVIDKIEEVSQ